MSEPVRNFLLPISDESGKIQLMYDGEIYNYTNIKEELESLGRLIKSDKESEIIINAYLQWGLACLEKFNGVWSIAIYDGTINKLFLIRDRYGTKPLYYQILEENLIFSSEILGILVHSESSQPNDRAVIKYLHRGQYIYGQKWLRTGETFFNDIFLLFPGAYLSFDYNTRKTEHVFWYIGSEHIEHFDRHNDDPIKYMRKVFIQSIKDRLPKNTTVASSLSGGIDSSSIVCTIRHEYPDLKINTYSMVHPGEPYDESEYVKMVVDFAKTNAVYLSPNSEELSHDLLDLIRTQQEPFLTLAVFGQYKMMQKAHDHGIKIMMDGMGADLLLRPHVNITEYVRSGDISEILRRIIPFIQLRMEKIRNRKIAKSLLKEIPELYLQEKDFAKFDVPNTSFDIRDDRNGMRWGVSTRMPFQDKLFQEFGAGLPFEWRVRNGYTKYIFRQAMKGILPSGILERRTKQGFVLPVSNIMSSGEMQEKIENIFSSKSFLSRKYWDGKAVQKKYHDFCCGKEQWNDIFWRILNVEIWLRIYFDSTAEDIAHEAKI